MPDTGGRLSAWLMRASHFAAGWLFSTTSTLPAFRGTISWKLQNIELVAYDMNIKMFAVIQVLDIMWYHLTLERKYLTVHLSGENHRDLYQNEAIFLPHSMLQQIFWWNLDLFRKFLEDRQNKWTSTQNNTWKIVNSNPCLSRKRNHHRNLSSRLVKMNLLLNLILPPQKKKKKFVVSWKNHKGNIESSYIPEKVFLSNCRLFLFASQKN